MRASPLIAALLLIATGCVPIPYYQNTDGDHCFLGLAMPMRGYEGMCTDTHKLAAIEARHRAVVSQQGVLYTQAERNAIAYHGVRYFYQFSPATIHAGAADWFGLHQRTLHKQCHVTDAEGEQFVGRVAESFDHDKFYQLQANGWLNAYTDRQLEALNRLRETNQPLAALDETAFEAPIGDQKASRVPLAYNYGEVPVVKSYFYATQKDYLPIAREVLGKQCAAAYQGMTQ